MILLPHFDIAYGFGLGKIPRDLPFQGPVFFGLGKVRVGKVMFGKAKKTGPWKGRSHGIFPSPKP